MLKLSLMPDLRYEDGPALPPQMPDLQRLYDLIIEHRSTTVLEFGCGYSTYIIAQALKENREWFDGLEEKPEVRNSHLFEGFAVDTNESWIEECRLNIDGITFHHSPCMVASPYWNVGLCHVYASLPDVVPDFIYLDGPDPDQVNTGASGLTFTGKTPIAADILFMEPILLPGTVVLIDGRTNNARFLRRNLKRLWSFMEDREDDYTLMMLEEPRLGKINVIGRDILEWLRKKN